MPSIWRLVKSRYSRTAFDGEGSRLYGARWSSPGTVVAYGSESPALAVLEVLVHLQSSNTLKSFSLARADVPDDLVEVFGPNELPLNWKQSPPPAEAQAVGDAWICERRSAALRVPSAVVDLAYNYLLNPAHADFAKIEIREPRPFTLNARLLGPE